MQSTVHVHVYETHTQVTKISNSATLVVSTMNVTLWAILHGDTCNATLNRQALVTLQFLENAQYKHNYIH